MTWFWYKRWLEYKRRKSLHRYKKIQLVSTSESTEGRETSTDKQPTVYVKDCGHVPLLLVNAAYVIERNLRTKGLFQTKGDHSKAVTSLLTASRKSKLRNANVHDVVESMKTFLVGLPDSFLPEYVCDALMNASGEDCMTKYVFVLRELRFSSPSNFAILNFMMRLLKKVSEHSMYNGMDVRKLASILVLDVIKPLDQKGSNDEQCLRESMQRLPFLITIVEYFIENVSVFQMVDSANEISSSKECASSTSCEKTSSAITHQTSGSYIIEHEQPLSPTESCTNCSETKIKETLADVANTGSRNNPTSQQTQNCEHCNKNVRTSSSQMKIKVVETSSNNKSGLADSPSHKEIKFKLKDVIESEVDIPSCSVFAKNAPEETSKKRKKKLRSGQKSKSSSKRKRSVRIDTAKSSPDNKPTKYARIKNSAGTMKKKTQKSGCNVKKLNSEQEDEKYATYIQDADDISLPVQKDTLPLDHDSRNTEEINMAAKNTAVTELPFLEETVPLKLEGSKNQEATSSQDTPLENSQMTQGLSTEKHEERPIVSSDIRGTADANDVALSHNLKIKLRTQSGISEMPEMSFKFSSQENASTSKRHSNNISVKSNTGVNTTPSLHISLKSVTGEDTQLVCDTDNETSAVVKFSVSTDMQNGKLAPSVSGHSKNGDVSPEPNGTEMPNTVACDRSAKDSTVLECNENVLKDSTRPSVSECDLKFRFSGEMGEFSGKTGERDASIKEELGARSSQVSESASSRSNDQTRPSTDVHHTIVLKVRNELSRCRCRSKHKRHHRTIHSLTAQQIWHENVINGALMQAFSYGQYLVNIFAICTIIVCLCVLLLFILGSIRITIKEDWQKQE